MSDPAWNEIFSALRNRPRRQLLVSLLDEERAVEGLNVPEDVHAGERDLETLQVELFHNHLPLLSHEGYVDWDRENHRVTRGPRYGRIRPVLDLFEERRDDLPADWP